MAKPIDLYGTYANFTDNVMEAVRRETFIRDIGQNSWLTAEELDRFLGGLRLAPGDHLLEVASGSGGPSLYAANHAQCRVTGIDVNPGGIETATQGALKAKQSDQVDFKLVDANARLPFDDDSFESIICIDAMNHFPNRQGTLQEWHRVLHPGRRALFTDPVVITGPVTNEELALRSSIGFFLFVPPGVNERLIAGAGFRLVSMEDVTESAALISGRWHEARKRHRDALIRIEGDERFAGLQQFFSTVHRLTSERRLSRFAYFVEKPGQ